MLKGYFPPPGWQSFRDHTYSGSPSNVESDWPHGQLIVIQQLLAGYGGSPTTQRTIPQDSQVSSMGSPFSYSSTATCPARESGGSEATIRSISPFVSGLCRIVHQHLRYESHGLFRAAGALACLSSQLPSLLSLRKRSILLIIQPQSVEEFLCCA